MSAEKSAPTTKKPRAPQRTPAVSAGSSEEQAEDEDDEDR